MNAVAAPASFWQFIWMILCWLEAHATRAIGMIGGILGILGASNVIPSKYIPYCMLGVAICTYLRGQVISNRVDQANTIISSQKANP